MSIDTSDLRPNPNEQIEHSAKVIGKSKNRNKVFLAILTDKKRFKTVPELVLLTKLARTILHDQFFRIQ